MMKKTFANLFVLIISFLLLFNLPYFLDDIIYAWFSIFILIFSLFQYLLISTKSIEKALSPLSIFIYLLYIYTIFGVYMWIINERSYLNYYGEINFVLQVFSGFTLLYSYIAGLTLNKLPIRNLKFQKSDFTINQFIVLLIIILQYFGAFLFTDGFSYIPILMDNIDIARSEFSNLNRSGAGLGIILIYTGAIGMIITAYSNKQKMFMKIVYFVIFMIPFLLYGGRLNIIFPILVLFVLNLMKKNIVINLKIIIKTTIFIFILLILLFLFATYRSKGSLEADLIVEFITADLFPEFRSAVGAYSLNNKDITSILTTSTFSLLIPGPFATFFGIEKDISILVGKYIGNLLGLSVGIRTTFIGELLLTNPSTFIIYLFVIFIILSHINNAFFKYNTLNLSKSIYLIIGLYFSFIVPYGITILPNFIFIYLYFSILIYVILRIK